MLTINRTDSDVPVERTSSMVSLDPGFNLSCTENCDTRSSTPDQWLESVSGFGFASLL